MEQVSFGSIMRILIRHASQSEYTNQAEFAGALFADFLDQDRNKNYTIDDGWISKCIKDSGGLDPELIAYYDHDNTEAALVRHLDTEIFPMLADPYMALADLHDLLVQDTSIHELKKRELYGNGLDAGFAARLLRFALVRKLKKPGKHAMQMSDDGRLSPGVQGYILDDHLPSPCHWFRGRKREAEVLHELLFQKRKVFLRGIPGIGKSELVKYYVKRFRTSYTNTIYFNSTGDLYRDILELSFADDGMDGSEEQRFSRHHRYLKSLHEVSLPVIDNFNWLPEQEALLGEVLNYHCRILFTTRCRYEDYETMEVTELPEKDLINLVNCFYPIPEEAGKQLKAILGALCGHTLAVEMAARLLRVGMKTPEELLQKLREQGQAMDDPNKVGIRKDGHNKKATYYHHMRMLDRGRLSMQHSAWIDRQWRVYMNYPLRTSSALWGKVRLP